MVDMAAMAAMAAIQLLAWATLQPLAPIPSSRRTGLRPPPGALEALEPLGALAGPGASPPADRDGDKGGCGDALTSVAIIGQGALDKGVEAAACMEHGRPPRR